MKREIIEQTNGEENKTSNQRSSSTDITNKFRKLPTTSPPNSAYLFANRLRDVRYSIVMLESQFLRTWGSLIEQTKSAFNKWFSFLALNLNLSSYWSRWTNKFVYLGKYENVTVITVFSWTLFFLFFLKKKNSLVIKKSSLFIFHVLFFFKSKTTNITYMYISTLFFFYKANFIVTSLIEYYIFYVLVQYFNFVSSIYTIEVYLWVMCEIIIFFLGSKKT